MERNLNVLRHRFQAATSSFEQAEEARKAARAAYRQASLVVNNADTAAVRARSALSKAKEEFLKEALKPE